MLQAAALAPVAETGESEDVVTRVRPQCDGTGLCRAQIWRVVAHTRAKTVCEIWALNFNQTPSKGGAVFRGAVLVIIYFLIE